MTGTGSEISRQYLGSLLELWGAWCERHGDDSGLPAENWIVRVGWGAADQQAGHKILCRDMPKKIWFTNQAVIRLPDKQREAVTAWYCFRLRPDGGYWQPDEKASMLGVNYSVLSLRLQRARRRLASSLAAYPV